MVLFFTFVHALWSEWTFCRLCSGQCNSILLFVLFMKGKYRAGPTLYLGILAFMDIGTCTMYILLFTMDCIWVSWNVEWVYHMWHAYTLEVYAISKICKFRFTFHAALSEEIRHLHHRPFAWDLWPVCSFRDVLSPQQEGWCSLGPSIERRCFPVVGLLRGNTVFNAWLREDTVLALFKRIREAN